jgi:hypothetical protein
MNDEVERIWKEAVVLSAISSPSGEAGQAYRIRPPPPLHPHTLTKFLTLQPAKCLVREAPH